jgi:hypothetical protein
MDKIVLLMKSDARDERGGIYTFQPHISLLVIKLKLNHLITETMRMPWTSIITILITLHAD